LDYTGHIALCDFGLCKLDMKDEDKTNSKRLRSNA
jgi:serum/glucocorticoid-regulated kinase 2